MCDNQEWAVVIGSYPRFKAVGPITKQTAQRIYFPHTWRKAGEEFADLGAVKYRGDEAVCRSMVERMISSEALMDQERQAAVNRHRARVVEIAKSAPQTPSNPLPDQVKP